MLNNLFTFVIVGYTVGVAWMQPSYEIALLQVQDWEESGIDVQGSDVERVWDFEVVHFRMFLLFGKQQKSYCLFVLLLDNDK